MKLKQAEIIAVSFVYCLYPLLSVLCFRMGALFLFPVWFCLQTFLSIANYYMVKKKRCLLLLDIVLALTVIASGYISTYLYTSRVSDDGMSYAIGMLGAVTGALYVMILAAIKWIIRFVRDRAAAKNMDENI